MEKPSQQKKISFLAQCKVPKTPSRKLVTRTWGSAPPPLNYTVKSRLSHINRWGLGHIVDFPFIFLSVYFFCLYISLSVSFFFVFVHVSYFAPLDSLSLFCVTKSTGKLWSFKHSTFENLFIDALFEGAKLFYELDRPSVTYSLSVILLASYHSN